MTWNAESDRKILLVMATDPKKCKGEEFKAKFAETLRGKPAGCRCRIPPASLTS